jgi:hypothetical protein
MTWLLQTSAGLACGDNSRAISAVSVCEFVLSAVHFLRPLVTELTPDSGRTAVRNRWRANCLSYSYPSFLRPLRLNPMQGRSVDRHVYGHPLPTVWL